MIMPNAHMPVGRDVFVSRRSQFRDKVSDVPPNAKANWKNETAARPLAPKHWCIISIYEFRPLNFALITMSRIVQSVTAQRTTRSTIPVKKPACRIAYGRPVVPQGGSMRAG